MSRTSDTVPSVQVDFPEATGGWDAFIHLVGSAGQLRRSPVRGALWHQVQRGALDFMWLAAVLGALAGFFTLITIETGFGFGIAAGMRVLNALVLGQLAGFAGALLLVAGPGTAAVFELALMRQQGELRTLKLLGIDPRDLLVLPRVLGFACSLMVLAFVFQAAAGLGGPALAALFSPVTFTQQMAALSAALPPSALAISGLRSLVLGAVLGGLVCQQGLGASFSPARAPQVVRQFLGRSLVAFVIVHGLFELFSP